MFWLNICKGPPPGMRRALLSDAAKSYLSNKENMFDTEIRSWYLGQSPRGKWANKGKISLPHEEKEADLL